MSSLTNISLVDFTAHELPAKKWMKLVRPKMRLRVRLPHQNRNYVSSFVRVGHRSTSANAAGFLSVSWPWNDDERFPQPCFADDEMFEVEIERRFLLWHKCIRRTKPVTIDQVRTGNDCALPLYDGQPFSDVPEERIELGEIMFTLRSDPTSEDELSEGKTSFTTCS